ncbi:trehalose-phosphatase [Paracoccus sp. IB05]|uniref:trehalose-phosphatase n=1 Tax=Paracoccus sp. IB05 TaxID=2779367 RepID=UPI0018E77105|nr:trehalose-phosphatase [Paracoccus sp. IB05]MBJ2149779.1 trehalose-phosphatase [Paracoccus sp. IB05]
MTTENRQASPAAQKVLTPLPPHQTRPPTAGEGRERDPALPDLAGTALFLDLDGTLLDLAATPDEVVPEPGLAELLAWLEDHVSGALALVTGRRVGFVDSLFPQHRFTVAGLHGAEIRPGAVVMERPATTAPQGDTAAFRAAFDFMRAKAADHPGLLIEDKGAAFALHYRLAPDLRGIVEGIMAEALVIAGPAWRLRDGKCVVELGPAGVDKGAALRNLMASPPFIGRLPLAAGDDLTDEAMFQAVNSMGGLSIRIGDQDSPSAAIQRITTPGAFRSWLHQLAGPSRPGD